MGKDTDRDDLYRAFYASHEAYYADVCGIHRPEITVSLSSREGGTAGEFTIRWHQLGGELVPRLEAFADSWAALVDRFGDLLRWLADHDNENVTPEDVKETLRELGVEDDTQYTGPPQAASDPPATMTERVEALQRLIAVDSQDAALAAPIVKDLARVAN